MTVIYKFSYTQMELHVSSRSLCADSNASLCPYQTSLRFIFRSRFFHRLKFRGRLRCNLKPLRAELCSEATLKSRSSAGEKQQGEGNLWDDSGFVEVIGIGSRKDAILDFCLNSPFCSDSFRFWDILTNVPDKVQLQERLAQKDISPRVVEAPLILQSCSKAVILVAKAGFGLHHTKVIDILKRVKFANGLAVGIILKPFSFEGRRRQDEVNDLEDKLQQHTSFCVAVNTNALLEKNLVTLDEALKTANNAVLMAIYAVSVLISEKNKKLLHSVQNGMKELKVSEVTKILDSYKDAKIGFGAGYNMKTSIMRAVYDCPFLGVGLKNLDGTVICIIASSEIDSNDVPSFLDTFRQITEFPGEIAVSVVQECKVAPNQIISTVIAVGCTRCQAHQESSIFSKMAKHFPFFFNLLKRSSPQSDDTAENDSMQSQSLSKERSPLESKEMPSPKHADEIAEDLDGELQMLLSNNDDQKNSFSHSERNEAERLEVTTESSHSYDQDTEGAQVLQRDLLIRRVLGPDYQISEEWASEGAIGSRAPPMIDNLSIFRLPVGVKAAIDSKNSLTISSTSHPEKKNDDDMKNQTQGVPNMSWDTLTDAGAEIVKELNDNGSPVVEGNSSSVTKRQGVLSVRAASMLESERDSKKKWNPMVVMKYRGGTYKGRCQGGLPEGKGRLSLDDGSTYDGMWRYGKRSGPGTFYFSNGDVFQGSWRDDVMHGKGWFYFHTGDRWFVNFWKGKPNGEGRFYSQLGKIFFGHFKDGWRHGHFLCINIDGSRCLENWEEGVLVSRKQLDSDTDVGA